MSDALRYGLTEIGHPIAEGSAGKVDKLKLGFWIFLGSECVFFASLIGTYLAMCGRQVSGPAPMDVFNIPMTTVSSFVLLMSSFTMVLAVAAIQNADVKAMRKWLLSTALLGIVFLGFQVFEFASFYHEGLSLTGGIFGATFFTLTGFHGLHVAIGVLWLLSVFGYSLKGGITPEKAVKVELAGLYWHFVDVVWIAIFTVVYLFEVAR